MSSDDRPSCLVTRPAHQGSSLIDSLRQRGFEPLSFPAIAIEPAPPSPALRDLPWRIEDYDLALFVSRNAVDHAFRYLDATALPAQLQLGAIGRGTAQALRTQGVGKAVIPAAEFNSEGLLAAPELQSVKGKRVIIFRGQAGRNLLGNSLRERGARVDYCEVYRRALPDLGPADYQRLTGGRRPDIALFTSSEGLRNTLTLLDDDQAAALRRRPWLLISDRMRETARDLGHNAAILIADRASDTGLIAALERWKEDRQSAAGRQQQGE